MSRPRGVTAIACLFFGAAAYLAAIALIRFIKPEAVSLMLGSPLIEGLELAGPYMFLVMAAVGAVIAAGLFALRNRAGRLAAIAALLGLVMLVPVVSAAGDRPSALAFSAIGVIVRVMILWYLYQAPVAEAFSRGAANRSVHFNA